jgi:hypothetical protein
MPRTMRWRTRGASCESGGKNIGGVDDLPMARGLCSNPRRQSCHSRGEALKKLITVCAVALAFAGSAWATTQKEAPTMQQGKMATCNKEAGDKKGDERKAFMKECLGAKADGRVAQQEKMKKCNADAKGKTGDERKAFMSECLKA